MTAWPSNPVIYELNTAASAPRRQPADRGPRDVGGRLCRRLGPRHATGRRCRVADGGVGTGAGRRGTGDGISRAGRVVPSDPAGLRRRRRDRLGLLHQPLRGRRRLGGRAGLAAARAARATAGRAAAVDFVPNHVAPTTGGSPIIPSTSCRALRRTSETIREPSSLSATTSSSLTRRDPYFPPWPDVAQLNAFAPGLRRAAAETLNDIAEQADGVRCDMAMLLLNAVFARTWGDRAARSRTTSTGPR